MEILRKLFIEIWGSQIKDNYSKGIITTEGSLQAHFYRFLKNETDFDKYEIWVVPTLYFDFPCEINKNYPDLLISLNSEIVCIVELKYNIEIGVNPYEDLKKLKVFSDQSGINKLELRIDPKSGN